MADGQIIVYIPTKSTKKKKKKLLTKRNDFPNTKQYLIAICHKKFLLHQFCVCHFVLTSV